MRFQSAPALVVLGAVSFAGGIGRHDATAPGPEPEIFEELSLVFEANVNDGDGEVILHAETGQPLQRLALMDPYGRAVHVLDASHGTLGLSELRLESGEPTLDEVRLAFPEGTYVVRAQGLDGKLSHGTVELCHDLPARAQILSPLDGEVVDLGAVVVTWSDDANVDRYTLEIEDEEDERRLHASPQPGTTRFEVPSALLRPGTEYQVVLVSHAENGNRVVQECWFHTAP